MVKVRKNVRQRAEHSLTLEGCALEKPSQHLRNVLGTSRSKRSDI